MTVTLQQIPGTQITLTSHRRLKPTSLSTAIRQQNIVGNHAHRWKFAFAKGNLTACSIEKKGNRTVYFRTNNPSLGIFLDMLVDYRGRNEAERWCRRVLDTDLDDENYSSIPVLAGRLSQKDFEELAHECGNELMLKN